MPSATCPDCGATGHLGLSAAVEVTLGTVAAVLERRPVVVCPEQHGRSPAGLASLVADRLTTSLPHARARRLRGDACDSCGVRLSMPVRRTTRTVSIDGEGLPVLTIHVDVAMTRCPECGLDQVPSRSQPDVAGLAAILTAPPA